MITSTEIPYNGRMQMALINYDVRYGIPVIVKVKIGLEDVTKNLNRKALKIINKTITADSIRRISA